MTPKPQGSDASGARDQTRPASGDKVVISGVAGLYPQARHVKDLQNVLYNKLNPVSAADVRWDCSYPEAAKHAGSVSGLQHFDAQFFKVHYNLAHAMDPMSRKLMELTYEALYDAGINATTWSGKNIGVYVALSFSETDRRGFFDSKRATGFGIVGCSKAMYPNRISYWLNSKGPSVALDESNCGSILALHAAQKAILSGECEAAIVGGAYVCLLPELSIHYKRAMKVSPNEETKSFSEDADGCVNTEAINIIILQKASDAKRIYADLVHIKCEYSSMANEEIYSKFGFNRDSADLAKFYKEFYDEVDVAPNEVEYVEGFGSADPEADKSELEAIDKVFCNGREEPLLVGSITSNIGHGEAASGISAVTKVLLGYHTGVLAGNLHGEAPRRDVAALREGRLRVLADHQPFHRGYTAVNSMSVTGVNAHVLLRGNIKSKDLDRYKTNIPRLVTISSRQDTIVARALDILRSHPIDPEELALLHSIHETNTLGHLGKGYTILDTDSSGATVSLAQQAEYCDGARRPLWFVYSGMGSQWAGMGAQLMRIPIFAAAIQRCHKVLEPKGLDIVHIITSPDKTIFDNILHSFVGIAAVQIGLTDILHALGLVPDKIIGHSVGELGCAYADGCLTAEEMILAAYSRGRVSLETPFIRGSMAAVGLGARQLSSMCPPEIVIACHNSAESCTISGPAEAMRSFVAELTGRGIFAKEVPCSNIAYHSRYIAEAGPGLLKYLKEVISTPRARSERWVSSSVPQARWQEPAAQYSSAEYHTNNLLSPVLFEEASAAIPADAVLVEVAPHGLLQAILKRALPDSAANIPLTRRGHPDSILMLLEAIGKLYVLGYTPLVRVLYPKVEFPVSTGTPFLSHLVEWAHQEEWPVIQYTSSTRAVTASCSFFISVHDVEHSYLQGHVINNKTLLPFSFALVAAWDTLAMTLNVPKKSISVKLKDVQLYSQPILHQNKVVKLDVSLFRGNGWFEVNEEHSKVATGFIFVSHNLKATTKLLESTSGSNDNNNCTQDDLYHILRDRGYSYSETFKSIHSTDESISTAKISWNNNWVTFIDTLMQLNILKYTHSGISKPAVIGMIAIDIKNHLKSAAIKDSKDNDAKPLIDVELSEVQNRTRTTGVVIENISFYDVPQKKNFEINLQALKFVPRFCADFDVPTSLYILLQIAAESKHKANINVLGINFSQTKPIFEKNKSINKTAIPGINFEFYEISFDNKNKYDTLMYKNMDVILVSNLSKHKEIGDYILRLIQPNTFIINEEDNTNNRDSVFSNKSYNIVSALKNTKSVLQLAYWRPSPPPSIAATFAVFSEADLPLLTSTRAMRPQKCFLIVTSYPPVKNLMDHLNQWRLDAPSNNTRVVMIHENSRDKFNEAEINVDINLEVNTFNNGLWGGHYYIPLVEASEVKEKIKLKSEVIGDLNSLQWVRAPDMTESDIVVEVHYAGISQGDVKQALGLTSHNKKRYDYGMEFSGTTESGSRVMGLVSGGAARSTLAARPELTWPVPPHWTLEDAATVPLAYFLAYYCLDIKPSARTTAYTVQGKYTVLVHGGAGALGQAAINIAIARGWRVFTTVADSSKKRFLLKLFPQLNENDIGNSRDNSFRDIVMNATNGMGCNIVMCCLKGSLKNTCLSCCGLSSIMIETNQSISNDNYLLGMHNMTKDRSYAAVDLMNVLSNPKSKDVQILHSLVSEGIALGEVRPLSRVCFAEEEAARAFRLVAASRHRGRALLRLNHERAAPRHRVSTSENSSHVIICDSTTLGYKLADSLIDRGIRRLHIHVKSVTKYFEYLLRVWERKNVVISTTYGSLDDLNDVSDLLQMASKFGPVNSLYVITDGSFKETVIKNIGLESETTCPALQHFIVLSRKDHGGYQTCSERAQAGLLSTLLDLSKLKLDHEVDGATSYQELTSAIERAIQSSESILLAVPNPTLRRSLLQEISALTDIAISADVPHSASLEQLRVPVEISSSICYLLKDEYNTCLDEEQIPKLTIERLKEIEDKHVECQFKEVNGLEIFFSHIEPDELLATTEMVHLPTLTTNYLKPCDISDASETYLCIVPGLEGNYERFRALCKRLKLPAFVLQPRLDHPHETPAEVALRYYKILLEKAQTEKSFYILGYETGVLVALELAAILEEHGGEGTVFCLGAGPAEVGAALEQVLRPYGSSGALQAAVARHMCALMARSAGEHAERALSAASSWGARVDACVRALRGRVPHSAQYARALLEAAHGRIGAARRAAAVQEAPRALRSRLVLLRARTDAADSGACSLQRYSRQPLLVRDLAAPLAHAAADPRAPAIINSCLKPQLLQAFNDKNLCDSYLL